MDDLMEGIGCISEDFVNNYLVTIDKYLMNADPNAYYSAEELGTEDLVRVRALKNGTYAKPTGQLVWDATASDGFFTISRHHPVAEQDRLKRGTKVTLHLKDEYLVYLDETKLRELVDKCTFDVCPYPISVSVDDHQREKKRRNTAGREEDLESLKEEFEVLRELCVQALRNTQVEKVIVDDRVFDLPSHLSDDGKTFFINPRNPHMKSLLVHFNENHDKEKVMSRFLLNFLVFSPVRRMAQYYKEQVFINTASIDDDDDAASVQ